MKTLILMTSVTLMALMAGCGKYSRVESFDAKDGYRCIISTEDLLEPSDPYFYSIEKTGKEIVPISYINSYASKLSFSIIETSDHSIFAIVESDRPNIVLAIHDKTNDFTWPHRSGHEGHEEAAIRGKELIRKLSEKTRNTNLILSSN